MSCSPDRDGPIKLKVTVRVDALDGNGTQEVVGASSQFVEHRF